MNESSFFESLCNEDRVTETKLASALGLVSVDELQEIMEKQAGPGSALLASGGALAKGTMLGGAVKGLAKSPGRAAIAGGAIGAAHGAMTAGTNPQTGQPNSMLGGALKGAVGGAALGAGAGVASRAGLAYAGGGAAGVQKVMGGLGRQVQRGAEQLNQRAGQAVQQAKSTATKAVAPAQTAAGAPAKAVASAPAAVRPEVQQAAQSMSREQRLARNAQRNQGLQQDMAHKNQAMRSMGQARTSGLAGAFATKPNFQVAA